MAKIDLGESSKRLGLRSAPLHGKDAKLVFTAQLKDQQPANRKPVFRPILSSPFAADWPSVNAADASAILHNFVALAQLPIIRHNFQRLNSDRPRNSAGKTKEKNARRRVRYLHATLEEHGLIPEIIESKENGSNIAQRVTSDNTRSVFLRGVNTVTRTLEEAISEARGTVKKRKTLHRSSMILVCLDDISPPSLVAHLPLMVATYNAICAENVRLIRLPAGSEEILSDAVALRRCSVLSCDFETLRRSEDTAQETVLAAIEQLFEACDVKPLKVDWLEDVAKTLQLTGQRVRLAEPHIKHLRSSKPNDLTVRKAARKDLRIKRKAIRASRSLAQSSRKKRRRRDV